MPEDYNQLAYSLAGVKRKNPYDHKRTFAQRLQQMGSDTSPVDHPLQGAARLAQALVGGWMGGQADRDEAKAVETERADSEKKLAAVMAEPDPQKRIALIGTLNPKMGMQHAGALAVEQAKLGQQQAGLQTAAQNFGGSYGMGGQGGPQSASVPPLPQGQPNASGFNNNLGNIRATPINWQDKGAPHNGFETFNTPQAGANAMVKNLGAYVQRNPNITVAQAIAQWAPPNENNTDLYIRQLAESTGINPGMPLAEVLKDPAVAAQMLDAITRKEKGGLPQGVNADTFMTATTPGGQPQPPPLTINMTQPQGIPQGDNIGTPPPPSPQVVGGPTVQAAPAVPDVPRPRPSQQQIQQYQQRLATGEFGVDQGAGNRARAALEAELDRDWGVQRDRAKMQFGQQSAEYSDQRKAQAKRDEDDRTRNLPSRQEVEKLHTARTEAAAIVSALTDFQREFQNTGTWGAIKSVAGATTPVNTAYNTAALLAKGEQLFNLGVLNGPDLDIIRRTLPDPSTFKGAVASTADMEAAVGKVIDLVQTRLAAREKQLGVPVTDVRGAANEIRATMPGGPTPQPTNGPIAPGAIEQGYRFKGGNPADKNNWEPVR